MKTLKTALSLLMVLCLLLSLGAVAFADGEGDPQPATDPASAGAADAAPALSYPVLVETTTTTTGDGTKVEVIGVDRAVSVDTNGTETTINQEPLGGNTFGIVIPDGQTTWVPDKENGVPITNNSGTSTVDIGGSIETSLGDGLHVINPSGSITVNVGDDNTVGNVTGACGVYIDSGPISASTTVNIYGSVTGGSGENSAGLYVDGDGKGTVEIKGDINGGNGDYNCGIEVINWGSSKEVIVGGDVTDGIIVQGIAGTTDITVGSVDSNGKVTGGTVSDGILLLVGDNAEKASITLWKVDGDITGAEDSVIQKVIHYLVGLVQPEDGSISADKTTAQEGDEVCLKVNLAPKDGYEVKAYNGEGNSRVPLRKGSDGNFYYDVTRGGGILLSALLEKIKPAASASSDNWSDGYYLFCKAAAKQIKNAEQNATVTVDGTGWASFMRLVLEALAERPDVTLVVKYGTNKELTVPAGTDILALIGSAQDVTFAKLAKLVG